MQLVRWLLIWTFTFGPLAEATPARIKLSDSPVLLRGNVSVTRAELYFDSLVFDFKPKDALIWVPVHKPIMVARGMVPMELAQIKLGSGVTVSSGFKYATSYADCGAGPNGADIRDQSNCGTGGADAYALEGTTQAAYQAGATALSTCNPSISNSTNYYLTGDIINCSGVTAAINLAGKNHVKVDLNGYSVDGKGDATSAAIRMSGDYSGDHVFNGSTDCSINQAGCSGSTSSSTSVGSAQVWWHNMTFRSSNTTNPIAFQESAVPTSNTSGTYLIRLSYITSTITNSSGSRSNTIYFSGGNQNTNALIEYSRLQCDGTAAACQAGPACYTATCEIRDSWFTCAQRTTNIQDCRGTIMDGGPSTNTWWVHNVKIDCNNNRCFRERSRPVGVFEDNLLVNADTNAVHGAAGAVCSIGTAASCGAIHLDDNTSGIQSDHSLEAIRRITFKTPLTGIMIFAKGGTNYGIRDIFLSGTAAGTLFAATNWSTSGTNVTASICTSAAFSSTINIIALKPSTDTTVVNAWNSGTTDAASTGTVNNNIGPTGTPPTACPPSVL